MPKIPSDPLIVGPERRDIVRPKHEGVIFIALIAILVLVFGGAFVAERIRDLRSAAAQAQRQVSSIEQRVGRLELQMERLLAKQLPDGNEDPGRPDNGGLAKEGASQGEPTAALTSADIEIIRSYIKIPPPAAGMAPTMSVGTPVGTKTLAPLPSQIVDKLPRLAGVRFTSDRNGAIVIVAGNSNRATFIIPPN